MRKSTLLALITAAFTFMATAQAQQVSSQDLDSALSKLKAAEDSKDVQAIKQTAIQCFELAAKAIKTPKPKDESEATLWTTTTAVAKDVQSYGEYALNVAVLKTSDTQQRIDLFEALEKNRPDSQYLPPLFPVMLGIYAKMKPDRSFQFAQRAIARAPKDEDLLLVLANGMYERKQFDSAANFGTRLVAALSSHARPEGMPVADWEQRRTAMLGRGHWLAGMSYAAQNKYPQADQSLKAALPFVKSEPELLGAALFYIGVANYNLGRTTANKPLMRDALQYSEQAAATKSAFQNSAQQNVYAIKQELLRMR